MARGKKLSRQMARYLGSETAEADFVRLLAALEADKSKPVPKSIAALLQNIPSFLDIIDASYQKYEENLTVAERNVAISSEELMQANASINSMVNCLGQGFLMFDRTGICAPVYSMACQSLLEVTPAGKHIATVLHLDDEKRIRFESLLKLAFSETHAMSFEEVVRFAPRVYQHSEGRYIQLEYKPERGSSGKIEQVVVIATDITEQIRAQALAEKRKTLFESIERVLLNREAFGAYIRHVLDFAGEFRMQDALNSDPVQREIHTLKAGAGVFRLNELMNIFHDLESDVRIVQEKASQIIVTPNRRADYGTLIRGEVESIIGRFREILQIDVLALEAERSFDKKTIYGFVDYLTQKGLADLRQEFIRRVCAESLHDYLARFDLLLMDLAERFNKKIHHLRVEGEDVPFLPDLYGGLFESFAHIFRNIVDHGIEAVEERKANKKDETGRVEIVTKQVTDSANKKWLEIAVKDDGIGMNVAKLRAILASKDPAGDWILRSDHDVCNAIFTRSASTRDIVTPYAGRGIGMQAVRDEIEKAGGAISVESVYGKGTTFIIKIPYKLDL